MTLVALHKVTKYDVLKPYDLYIEQGDFIVLCGSNGSGKTTLFRLILSFIKPDTGKITKAVKRIAYLPEHVKLPFFMKSYMYILLHAKMKKVDVDVELLHLFNIPLFRYVHELSKGNQQKLAIITTLIGQAELIILDEPLNGLDDQSIKNFLMYMTKLKSQGKTFIVSTHQPQWFKKLQTRMIQL